MIDSQQTIKLASELSRLTKEGTLQWRREPHVRPSGSGVVRFAYSTRHQDVSLVIFEQAQRHFDPDSESYFSSSSVTLAVLGDDKTTEFEFPEVPGLDNLFDSVRFQLANRSGAVEKLFGALAK